MKKNKNDIVFLPWGSFEQHGPLLPPDTDISIANYFSKELNLLYKDSVLLPSISYGLASEHNGFDNSITSELFSTTMYMENLLTEIGKVYSDAKLIVIVNGHGGNKGLASTLVSHMNYKNSEYPRYIAITAEPKKDLVLKLFDMSGPHADSVESSILSFIDFNIKEGKYKLSEINGNSVRSHSLALFTTKKISINGIITPSEVVEINREKGKELAKNILSDIQNEINKTLELINYYDSQSN